MTDRIIEALAVNGCIGFLAFVGWVLTQGR